MTAWLGALLVAGAGMALGQLLAEGCRRRPRELRAWRGALQTLASEIGYAAAPLPQALGRAARAAPGACRPALEGAAEALGRHQSDPESAWRAAVGLAARNSPLSPDDVDALVALGGILGRTGREDQLRHLSLCMQRLEAAEADARERAGRDARLWAYLCALGALALAVALV